MIRTLLIIASALLFASCGRLHHTTATDTTLSKESGSTDVVESITTKETVDTIVTVKPDSTESVVDIVPDRDTTYTVIDNDRQSVEITYDAVAKKLRTKAVVKQTSVPVTINRETHIDRKVSADYKSVEKTKHHEEERTKTNPLIPWWFWFIIILCTVGYVVFRLYSRVT